MLVPGGFALLVVIAAAVSEFVSGAVLITPARLGKILLLCQLWRCRTTGPVTAAVLATELRILVLFAVAHFQHLIDGCSFVSFGFRVHTRLLVLSQLVGALVRARRRELCLDTCD